MAPKLSLEEQVKEAKRKAAEMKAKAAAKRAAKEAAGSTGAPQPMSQESEIFTLGEFNLILIDWDDTLFPTSAWKDRIAEGSNHPPRASQVQALSEAIAGFITTLQQSGVVKIVTHGTKGWFEHSSKILSKETKTLLDSLDHRYRDSHGEKYMRKNPPGVKYTTNIGVVVDNYGEWFKTDMFFHFISEKKTARKWDESHLPERVELPRQVLIIGDGNAEKRSYDEHGNQAREYAGRPGHSNVAKVGLKGVFLKDGPSFDELVLQIKWATAHVASTFLPPSDSSTMMWDLTSFPSWVCSEKLGPNAYKPMGQGTLLDFAPAGWQQQQQAAQQQAEAAARMEEEQALQLAIAASMADGGVAGASGGGEAAAAGAAAATAAVGTEAGGEVDEEERALQEALALSLS